mmetsp:Transcript_23025/g.50206  ORF Transcript_23025/g.50206 Transcript_23025/m.50206 type:complete len:203 (-) Transcript_23025:1993-2601(-)
MITTTTTIGIIAIKNNNNHNHRTIKILLYYRKWQVTSWEISVSMLRHGPTTTVPRTNKITTTKETTNLRWKWSWVRKLLWTLETNHHPACHLHIKEEMVLKSTGHRDLAVTLGFPTQWLTPRRLLILDTMIIIVTRIPIIRLLLLLTIIVIIIPTIIPLLAIVVRTYLLSIQWIWISLNPHWDSDSGQITTTTVVVLPPPRR